MKTGFREPCHREGQSPVAISWYNVRIGTLYQEIAAPLRARNDMVTFAWSHMV